MKDAAEIASGELRPVLAQFAPSKAALEEHKFFLPMMAQVVLNKLRPPSEIKKTLEELTEEDGRLIGRSLALSLAMSLSAEAGVDDWIGKCPALREFDDDKAFFRVMVVAVATNLLKEATWGAKLRLFVGAGESESEERAPIFARERRGSHANT